MKNLKDFIKESFVIEMENLPNNQYISSEMSLAEMISRVTLGYKNQSKDSDYSPRDMKDFTNKFISELSPKEITKYTKHQALENDIVIELWYTNKQIRMYIYAEGRAFELYQGHLNCEKDNDIKYRGFVNDTANNKRAFNVSKSKLIKVLKQIEIPVGPETSTYFNYPDRVIEGIKEVFGVTLKIWEVIK